MRLPKLCRNSDGRAFSRWKGKRYYHGKHDTPEAEESYRRFIQRIVAERDEPVVIPDGSPLLAELAIPYLEWIADQSPKQQDAIRQMVNQVLEVYGDLDISEFGPRKVLAWQKWLVGHSREYSRTTINRRLANLKRWLRWCVSRELIPAERHQAIEAVEPIKAGRTAAKEPEPVHPVPAADVTATLPYLPPSVAIMVQVQYLCGMRPQDVVSMRLCDVDRTGDIWLYRPASHKNKHRGQSLTKAIPVAAQTLLQPLLDRDDSSFLFDPREASEWAYERRKKTSSRKTKRYPCEEKRVVANVKSNHGRRRSRYSVDTYCQSVTRACSCAAVPKWTPGQLRHSIATELSRDFGEQAAQRWLGHARLETTAIYVEQQSSELIEIARRIDRAVADRLKDRPEGG
jgi:integrase